MADKGSVGFRNDGPSGPAPFLAGTFGAPIWFDPANRAIGYRNEATVGPHPVVGGRTFSGVPVDQITIIAATFGQSGGGVTIF